MEPIDISKLASQQQKRYESDFKELSKIGKGGFSKVYKVQNQVDKQLYAIKKVELAVKDIKDNIELKLERVLREARYLAKLSHPKIIRYYNSWVEVTSVAKPLENTPGDQKTFNNKITKSRDDEIVLYFIKIQNSRNSYEDSYHDIDNFIEFQQPIVQNFQPTNQNPIKVKSGQVKVNNIIQYLEKRNSIPLSSPNLGDIQSFKCINTNNDRMSYSEFELTAQDESLELIHDGVYPKKSRRLNNYKNLKLNTKKSTSQECKQTIEAQSNNKLLDQLEKIVIYIQTEICDRTLEDYINERNQKLLCLKKSDKIHYSQSFESYAKEAKIILLQIIDGLEYIHKNRLIHRDLKPSNIFMNSPNDVKIGDFGLVSKLEKFHVKVSDEEEQTEEHSAFTSNNYCTKMYASPEQIDFDRVKIYDHRMDIHALGMIILQLFHPMNTQMEIIKTMQDARKGQLPKSLEEGYSIIAQTIAKCLSKDPKHRPSLDDISLDMMSQSPFYNGGCTLSGMSTTFSQVSVFEFCLVKPSIDTIGPLQIQMEGSTKSKFKHCVLVNRQLLVYKREVVESKAQYNYNLDECTITVHKSGLEIHIVHPLQLGCTLLFPEEHLAGTIFRKLQFSINSELWKNQEHTFEND